MQKTPLYSYVDGKKMFWLSECRDKKTENITWTLGPKLGL